MLTRKRGNLVIRKEAAPAASKQLERDGYALIRNVLTRKELAALRTEVAAVFDTSEQDRPADARNEFRHAMLNRSPLSQIAIGNRAILDVIEPLLGEDCHVIANTAWRNVKGHKGGSWHIDAGPHVPRPEGVEWPDSIPYPIFAIGVHIFLKDCPIEAGPTAVIPGSHRSGRTPPRDRLDDASLSYKGKKPVCLAAKAGDASLFVSDAWHRGTPAQNRYGRFFLQAHYGRRDIAQRILPTADVNHLSAKALARAQSQREKTLVGLHAIGFYDG
jgi:ectoine hydroxylase-related dioxygenase (phytanoyl-CoA dioxygenase family)